MKQQLEKVFEHVFDIEYELEDEKGAKTLYEKYYGRKK